MSASTHSVKASHHTALSERKTHHEERQAVAAAVAGQWRAGGGSGAEDDLAAEMAKRWLQMMPVQLAIAHHNPQIVCGCTAPNRPTATRNVLIE